MSKIELAYDIIFASFLDRKDKAGAPYIFHLERVAAPFKDNEVLFVIALLHDLLEDFEQWSRARLEVVFGERIAKAVDALTKFDFESYEDYLIRVAENEDAVKVKLSDLRDNMDLTRLKRPLTTADILRVQKYHSAFLKLQSI